MAAAIVGIVATLVGPAIELGKCIAVPIKSQFDYLCCFNSNIEKLRDEKKKLEEARGELQMRVTAELDNARLIVPQVEAWLKDFTEINRKVSGFEDEIENRRSGGLTIKSHFSLSKRAKKMAGAMEELRGRCNFDRISLSAPPPSREPVPLGPSLYEFESRKCVEETIMAILRGKNVGMVGICGMGGVGKTTMAKQIMDRAKKENLFDEVLMVVVSQQAEIPKIQNEIAEFLGLTLGGESLSSKASNLRARLMCGKRILLVLDDVWRKLTLEDLGVPQGGDSGGCVVILTSRNKDVLRKMRVGKVYTLEVLSETEAWYLFKSNAGTCVDDQNVLPLAREVVKECRGLPIALVTLGVALKDKKSPSNWKDSLQQLKDSNPIDIPDFLDEVYKPLRLSYDLLESENAKSLFLFCCLFPEDEIIHLERVAVYAMGLRLFGEITSVEQTRNRMYSLAEMLGSRFLLSDAGSGYYVRMHDVIRDVAIFIASDERRINCSGCAWIYSEGGISTFTQITEMLE